MNSAIHSLKDEKHFSDCHRKSSFVSLKQGVQSLRLAYLHVNVMAVIEERTAGSWWFLLQMPWKWSKNHLQ